MAGHRITAARGTAAAVAAMAALTASQAPAATGARGSAPVRQAPAGHGPSVSGDTPYRTELPPLRTGKRTGEGAGKRSGQQAGAQHDGGSRITGAALPATVFAAYRRAGARLAGEAPGCHLGRQLLAAIGQVESGQANGGRVTSDGTTVPPILGPRLDGGAFAVVRDTDGGVYDGDAAYDRAVGPMQFIPSTWARWGADGNGDGRADPGNVFDAALAAGRYLCAGGRDLSDPAGLDAAVLGYNHSAVYLRTVRAWYAYFLDGHLVVPDQASRTSRASKTSRASSTPETKSSTHAEPSRPGATAEPTPHPTATPSAPASPSPSASRPAATAQTPEPLPLPGLGPLTGTRGDHIAVAPSTTGATGR